MRLRLHVPRPVPPPPAEPTIYDLGTIDYADAVNLQSHIAYELRSRTDGACAILVCSHPPAISLGRLGSRRHILAEDSELQREAIEIHYAARGGGAIVHGPGQIAVYVVAPLERLHWTPGELLRRLQQAFTETIEIAGIAPEIAPPRFGAWGTSGLLAALGIGVRHGISHFGGVLNVRLARTWCERVIAFAGHEHPHMGSLLSELAAVDRMEHVQEALFSRLSAALGCRDTSVVSGHPLLPAELSSVRELSLP